MLLQPGPNQRRARHELLGTAVLALVRIGLSVRFVLHQDPPLVSLRYLFLFHPGQEPGEGEEGENEWVGGSNGWRVTHKMILVVMN